MFGAGDVSTISFEPIDFDRSQSSGRVHFVPDPKSEQRQDAP